MMCADMKIGPALGANGAVPATWELRLQDAQFFRAKEGVTNRDVRRAAGNNDLDEALVRGDDGELYVLYADDFGPGIGRGVRINHEHLTGEIVAIFPEFDADGERSKCWIIAGVMFAGGLAAMPFTFGASAWLTCFSVLPALGGLVGESDSKAPRDPATFEPLRAPGQAITDPAEALKPGSE